MIVSENIPLKEINALDHSQHHWENPCMKLCIAAFQFQFEVDPTSEGDTPWEAVFFLKDLRTVKRDDVAETLACAAKSIFRLLYTQADCVGNQAISLRIMYGDKNEMDQKLTQLFTLSLIEELEETPPNPDDRAISHSYAYIATDLSQGALHFTFNDPQVEQMEKIITLLSSLFPNTENSSEESYCAYM